MTRVFRDVSKYVHKNNEHSEGSLLNKYNFSTLFPWHHKTNIKYELSATMATAYSMYALTLYEQDVDLIQKDGIIILRS